MTIRKLLYFSPLGLIFSIFSNLGHILFRPFMVYGYWNRPNRCFRRSTRFSSTVTFIEKSQIDIGDNCWIWHHTIIDGSNGVTIQDGAQIGAWVGIFTHSSHTAIRLHGPDFINVSRDSRIGYSRGSVFIGSYTFVGAGSYILPGVTVGKGCIISAKSVVKNDIPDFSIAAGNPARVIGSVFNIDKKYFNDLKVQESYFEKNVIQEYLKTNKNNSNDNR